MARRRGDAQQSKLLSFVLRHRPDHAGITLDAQGWVAVDALLAGLARRGTPLTRADLARIVAENDKQRFAFSADGLRIRASQGHSTAVDLGYAPRRPPAVLFHGTATRNLEPIRAAGLRRGSRHHVHLSADAQSARRVGARHGAPVVLEVAAGQMHAEGHAFYVSDNGVWLTEHVPPRYLREI